MSQKQDVILQADVESQGRVKNKINNNNNIKRKKKTDSIKKRKERICIKM